MEYIVFGALVAGFVVLIFAKGFYDERKKEKAFLYQLKYHYGDIPNKEYRPEQYASISRYFEKHPSEGQIDDITWNDLGMDEVFRRLNDTYSSAGEEMLYDTLRTPRFEKEELAHFEKLVSFFQENTEERVRLQVLFHGMGYTGKFSLYDYLDYLDVLGKRSNTKHLLMNFLYLPAIVLCVVKPSFGILALVGLMLYGIMSYFKEKGEIEPYITSFSYIMKMLAASEKAVKTEYAELQTEKERLSAGRKHLSNFKRGAFWLMSSGRMSGSGDPFDILFDYLRMIFHLDLIKFNSMLAQVRKSTADVDLLFSTLGYMEAAIAVGAYRKSIDGAYCVPTLFTEGKAEFSATDMYHPLLDAPVKNSITAKRGVLLTGSNASGKSTFLKTAAIAALFAQTIHTVPASSYEGSCFHICSSMALRDDLGSGESYYIVEIKAIKRILNIAEGDRKVLCFVDEVLRGTNTVERIAASTEILRSLHSDSVMCFAATHDVELTELLSDCYDNYHFEEEIIEGDVHFPYRLLTGKATTRNAIKLLSVMGYEEAIIENANRRAEHFMETGQWA